MAFVTVPKDLTKVKSKMLFGLTKRQLVCFSGALFIGVPLFFLLRGRVPTSAAALLMVFAMLPGLLLALYERHGQPLEVIAGQMIQAIFLRPKERPYQTNNLYAALMRQHQLEKEVKAIVKNRKENAPTGGRKKKADPRRTPRN
ncbi:PrgI family protein [[Clostridium] symbiosum]|uniref:PrgI family protein n=1 Tax=Clostridium symbiosum TaxID=1512 RepID=UPI0034A5B335